VGLPDLTFSIAFTTAPLATPTWATQADNKLLGFVSERGRGSELEEFQPGTATITLDNRDRAYDPANTSGANYGNLKPRKRAWLQATFNSITYNVFDGHVKAWPQSWEMAFGKCELPLIDAFELFTGDTFASALNPDWISRETWPQERSDQRVGRILDGIGWPAGRRTVSTGRVNVQAFSYEPRNALQHLRELEATEGGFLFMDAAGNVVFQDKYKRLLDYTTSQGTFSDAPTGAELPIASFEPDLDVEHIINKASGKRANVPFDEAPRQFETIDATSITDYGETARTFESWAAADTDAEARTQYFVTTYAQPVYRVKSITLDPQSNDSLWPHCLGRVIGEQITVKGNFFGKGSVLTQVSRIEGIRHEYTAQPLRWRTTFRLSPVFTGELQGYWQLGTAGKSELATTTRLIW
jgi:hypothetical protein